MFSDLIEAVDFTYFFLSALLFFAGMYFGPVAVEKDIQWLLRYPRWLLRLTQRYFTENMSAFAIFLLIFVLNNLSMMTGFLSGLLVVLPPVAAFLTGFNVAVVSFELLGWKGIWQVLINPVAWLEFPAAFISFSMAFSLAEAHLIDSSWHYVFSTLNALWPLYLKYVVTLLVAAAGLETGLIVLGRHLPKDN